MPRLIDLFPADGRQAQVSEEVEKEFFDRLRLKNGTYKTTYSHRLDDVNEWIAKYLRRGDQLRLLDVGISSGASTSEWIDALDQSKIDYRLTAVDLTVGARLVSFGDRRHVVLDRTNWPLLFEIDGRWFSNPPRKSELLAHWFELTFTKAALLFWLRAYNRDGNAPDRVMNLSTRSREISLVKAKLINDPRVTVREGNVLADVWDGPFDVIRVANVLNRQYFDDRTLAAMLLRLRAQLCRGGLLLVCRTDWDAIGRNRASIFRLTDEGSFTVVSALNGGSEIQDLILKLPDGAGLGTTPILNRDKCDSCEAPV